MIIIDGSKKIEIARENNLRNKFSVIIGKNGVGKTIFLDKIANHSSKTKISHSNINFYNDNGQEIHPLIYKIDAHGSNTGKNRGEISHSPRGLELFKNSEAYNLLNIGKSIIAENSFTKYSKCEPFIKNGRSFLHDFMKDIDKRFVTPLLSITVYILHMLYYEKSIEKDEFDHLCYRFLSSIDKYRIKSSRNWDLKDGVHHNDERYYSKYSSRFGISNFSRDQSEGDFINFFWKHYIKEKFYFLTKINSECHAAYETFSFLIEHNHSISEWNRKIGMNVELFNILEVSSVFGFWSLKSEHGYYSSGELRLLEISLKISTFIADSDKQEEKLILIDEVDLHFHPQWLVSIIEILDSISNAKNVNFLLTTHNTLVLSGLYKTQVYIMSERTIRQPNFEIFGMQNDFLLMNIFGLKMPYSTIYSKNSNGEIKRIERILRSAEIM